MPAQNPRPCGLLSLEFYGGVPPQNSSLKHYFTAIHGGTVRSGVVAWGGGTPTPHDKLNIRHGWAAWRPLVVGTARSAVVAKSGGTPPYFAKLKIRHGWAAWRPLVVGTARSGVVSKSSGTPLLFDKLTIRHGGRIVSSASD